MRVHQRFILLILIAAASVGIASPKAKRIAGSGAEELDLMLTNSFSTIEESSAWNAPLAAKEAADLRSQSTKSDDPLSIELKSENPLFKNENSIQQSGSITGQFNYKDRTGLEGQLALTSSLGPDTTLGQTSRYQIYSASLGQDLLNIGSNNPRAQSAEKNRIQADLDKALSDTTLLDLKVTFVNLTTEFYRLSCRKNDLRVIGDQLGRAVESAKARKKFKGSAMRDYLATLDLQNQFRIRLTALELEHKQLSNHIRSVSATLADNLAAAQTRGLKCEVPAAFPFLKRALEAFDIDRLKTETPVARAANLESQLATQEKALFFSEQRPSLTPSLTYNMVNRDTLPSYQEGRIGVVFKYEFGGDKRSKLEQALERQASAKSQALRDRVSRENARLLNLTAGLRALSSRQALLQSSRKTSETLLEVLAAQQDAGAINPSLLATSYINYDQTLSDLRDIWSEGLIAAMTLQLTSEKISDKASE